MKIFPLRSPVSSLQMREETFRNHLEMRDFQNNSYLGEGLDTDWGGGNPSVLGLMEILYISKSIS